MAYKGNVSFWSRSKPGICAIVDAIRAKLNPNSADISEVRIPMKPDTDSNNCRTPIPAQIGQ